MATSSSFFGMRKGSTKSLTFSVMNGKQVTKDRVSYVRNPKTQAQQIQRIIMNTAMQAYSVLRPICDHAFEGFAYGSKCQAEFMKQNLDLLRQKLADAGAAFGSAVSFCPIKYKFIALNGYKVSSGRLPKMSVTEDGEIFADENTYESVLLTNGLQRGDQLTFLVLTQKLNDPQQVQFDYARVILDPVDEFGKALPLTTEFAKSDGSITGANAKNNATAKFKFNFASQKISFGVGDEMPSACAVIVSRENVAAKSWLRSPARLVVNKQSQGLTMEQALAASQNSVDVENPYYLNGSNATAEKNVPLIASLKLVRSFMSTNEPSEQTDNSADLIKDNEKTSEWTSGGISTLFPMKSGTQTLEMRGNMLDQLNVTFKDEKGVDLVETGVLTPSVDYSTGRKWVIEGKQDKTYKICHFEATTADGTVICTVDVPESVG